ncbi:hypothetical protein NPIL_639781, partial [Nephila pilipes]
DDCPGNGRDGNWMALGQVSKEDNTKILNQVNAWCP